MESADYIAVLDTGSTDNTYKELQLKITVGYTSYYTFDLEYADTKWKVVECKKCENQEKLKSGINIKTINNQTIVGSGNIAIRAEADVQSWVDQGFDYSIWGEPDFEMTNYGSYPFTWQSSGGYYESTNQGHDATYSLCKLTFDLDSPSKIKFDYVNYAESGYDYGIFSNIDCTLSQSNNEDSGSNVRYSCKGNSSPDWQTLIYEMPAGEHFIYVKYRKDGSVSNYNDSLRFKVSGVVGITTKHLAMQEGATYDGTDLFGWYNSMSNGENVTENYGITVDMISRCVPGTIYSWPSTVSSSTTNNAMVIGADTSYGYKSGGGRYYTKDINIRGSYYTYAYDENEVHKGTWDEESGGLACFAAGTKVYTKDGLMNIEDIKVDEVMAANTYKDIIEPYWIKDTIHHTVNTIIKIYVNDEIIDATEGHQFWAIEKGRTRAADLESGDLLVDYQGNTFEITKVDKIENISIEVYEIMVEDARNYFVGNGCYQVFNEIVN